MEKEKRTKKKFKSMERSYELVVILDPELKTEEQEKLVNKIKKVISEAGELKTSKEWGKRELTYPISKKKEGSFWLYEFHCSPENVSSIKQKFQLEEKILRYLLTTFEKKVLPSAGKVKAKQKKDKRT